MIVELKDGLLDPQGKAIEDALPTLGFQGVTNVRVGKIIELDIEAASEDDASDRVLDMADRLLANPVIENVRFSFPAHRWVAEPQ